MEKYKEKKVISNWDKHYLKLCSVRNQLLSDIYSKDGNVQTDITSLDKEYTSLKEKIIKLYGTDEYKWLKKQQKDYQKNKLSYSKIKKLQNLGFIEQREQFNEEDKEIYLNFINSLPYDSIKPYHRNVSKEPFEKQMTLVRDFINKYYFRRDNQKYSLDDYIQVCSIGLYNAINSYNMESNHNYRQYVERNIIRELNENFGQQNSIYEDCYLKENDYYDNLDEEILTEELNEYILSAIELMNISKHNKKIIELAIYNIMTTREIAEKYNINIQRVYELKNKFLWAIEHGCLYWHVDLKDYLMDYLPAIKNFRIKIEQPISSKPKKRTLRTRYHPK